MVPGVDGRPGAAVAGIVDGDGGVVVEVVRGVDRLQVGLGRVRRDERRRVGLVPGALGEFRREGVLVERPHRGGARRVRRLFLQLVEGVVEAVHGVHHRGAAGVDDERVARLLVVVGDLAGAGLPDLGEPLERRLPERVAAGQVADDPGDDRRTDADEQQHDEQLRLDTETRPAEPTTTESTLTGSRGRSGWDRWPRRVGRRGGVGRGSGWCVHSCGHRRVPYSIRRCAVGPPPSGVTMALTLAIRDPDPQWLSHGCPRTARRRPAPSNRRAR